MATFIVLGTFEQAGVRELLGQGQRSALTDPARLTDNNEVTLTSLWFCVGLYDVVAVVEAPDLRRALAFVVAFSSRGEMRTVTLAAEGEWQEMLGDASQAATDWAGWIDRGGGSFN